MKKLAIFVRFALSKKNRQAVGKICHDPDLSIQHQLESIGAAFDNPQDRRTAFYIYLCLCCWTFRWEWKQRYHLKPRPYVSYKYHVLAGTPRWILYDGVTYKTTLVEADVTQFEEGK
jgi:hypothetical protein